VRVGCRDTRGITSGRLPASCTGNALLGAFSQMVSQVLPDADKQPRPGPVMADVFQGTGNWRLDFIDGAVLVVLRDSYSNALAKGGVTVTPGVSPYKYVASLCVSRTPKCQKAMDAITANAASAARGDANRSGTLPGVPRGTCYLIISTRYNNKPLIWEQAVQLKAGQNSLKRDQSNATPLN
jgi:hypothetical protein